MSTLIHQRCMVHQEREAAALCPECRLYYCRECVTEHLGRMMCAHCVAQLEAEPVNRRFSYTKWGSMSLAGLLFAWLVFYYLGMGLARIPSSFHGGTP